MERDDGAQPPSNFSIFTSKLRKQRMEVATSGGSIAATMISTDDKTGLATRIVPILRGGVFDTSAA